MPATPTKTAAAPDPAPVAPVVPITASTPAPALPWWMPQWPQVLGGGLYAMAFWLLWTLSPAPGAKPSELFSMLAQAIVLTAFVNGVVAAVYTSSRDSQAKNATIAAQAQAIASQAAPPSGA